MRIKSILIHYSLFTIPFLASAAVTQRWTVETSRVQPVVFEAVHGETLALEATFKSYGEPVEMPLNGCSILWQTNGMGSAWWQEPAEVVERTEDAGQRTETNYAVRATFTPAMDPGAATVIGFLGATGQNYRAAFTIRFRHGPGERPNTIAGPVPILDLANTTVINPPWPTEADFAATTTVMKAELKGYVDDQIEGAVVVTPQAVTNAASAVIAASNLCTKAYADYVGATTLEGCVKHSYMWRSMYVMTNEIAFSKYPLTYRPVILSKEGIDLDIGFATEGGSATNNTGITFLGVGTGAKGAYRLSCDENGIGFVTKYWRNPIHDYLMSYLVPDGSPVATSNMVENIGFIKSEADPTVPAWAKSANPPASMPDNGLVLTNDAVKTKSGTSITASQVGAADAATVNQMGQSLAAVSAHLNAEDARFVSTNYDSVVQTPEAYVEIKINNNWKTIWREMTRWGKFVGNAFNWNTWQGFHAWSTNVTAQLATKAERCWGIYDSETGEISPDGYTQISSSNILIAANMSYKRVVDTANAIWVLESNSGLATLGGTNGYFRVKDGDGNTQFEIVKGNLRELGCDAGGITVDDEGATPVLTIPYSVEAASHPTLKICTDLATADWKAESEATCAATVSWSGSSGAYVATVTAKSNSSKMFVKATYIGGEGVRIRQLAPVEMTQLNLNGTNYTLGVGTMGQNKLLSLNGNCVIEGGGGGGGVTKQYVDEADDEVYEDAKAYADTTKAPKLTGLVYDFHNGSNFTKRVYEALTNVIQTLGGTVTNTPTFN